jgi:MoxR-like ATPase
VFIHHDVVEYIVACIRQTRFHPDVHTGASPRTGVKLSRLARALALIRSADFVSIDIVKEIFLPVVSHRLIMKDPAQGGETLLEEILRSVPVELPSRGRKRGRALSNSTG